LDTNHALLNLDDWEFWEAEVALDAIDNGASASVDTDLEA
jgi:hypothetical protein